MFKGLETKYRHALVETASILCAALLLIFLVSIVVFNTFQGSQYFVPKSAYKVQIQFADGQQEVFYESSVLSENNLKARYDELYVGQFLAQPDRKPQVKVELAPDVYEAVLTSGRVYFGQFESLSSQNADNLPLTRLSDLLDTVALLQRSLTEAQTTQLKRLHQNIAALDDNNVAENAPARESEMQAFSRWQAHVFNLEQQIEQYQMQFRQADGQVMNIALIDLDYLYQPNQMTALQQFGFTLKKVGQFISDKPKQASTTGGVFPAIFGTILLVIIMAIVVAPFGIISAVYLHEYAPDNRLTALLRIGISNMAAVPSIVYGVFGLGFFVYTLGGSLDELFYSQNLPSPTFGTPGLLWASLTMGLLTLPVVIVSAEEGLKRVPNGLRAGSYALGATKFETILRVVIPMASPGMLTGIILAIARAAGEVAPLILVGAVKFAPSLPIDAEFPFVHLERQFMHLGVFIYDGAFHQQTESQSASLMFATCMLLLIIVFLLNISAIIFRNRLRGRYESV